MMPELPHTSKEDVNYSTRTVFLESSEIILTLFIKLHKECVCVCVLYMLRISRFPEMARDACLIRCGGWGSMSLSLERKDLKK